MSNKIINVFAEARKVAAALPGAFAECGERGGAVTGGRTEDSISPVRNWLYGISMEQHKTLLSRHPAGSLAN